MSDALRVTTLDIFFAPRAWDKHFAMTDVIFEENDNKFGFLIDRYVLRYEWSQILQLGVGQAHDPIVRWNRRNSHGLDLQTPISRPNFLDREVDDFDVARR